MTVNRPLLNVFRLLTLALLALLAGCNGGGDAILTDATSSSYPYLLSSPRVFATANSAAPSSYDVTVELEATGPYPIFSVGLWLYSSSDSSVFHHLDLQYLGGNSWSATTNTFLPLAPGDYYLDSILIEDGDATAGELVGSGWYSSNPILSTTRYTIEQQLTDWDTLSPTFGIVEESVGVSAIPVVTFSLP